MYVRLKTNRSGSTTVVVVEKRAGRQVYVKSIGTSSNPDQIVRLTEQGKRYIADESRKRCPELDFEGAKERAAEMELKAVESFLMRIENVIHDAPKRILDKVFDAVSDCRSLPPTLQRGAVVQDLEVQAGDTTDIPLQREQDQGPHQHLLRCPEGLSGIRQDDEEQQYEIECGRSVEHRQNHPDRQRQNA